MDWLNNTIQDKEFKEKLELNDCCKEYVDFKTRIIKR